MRSTPIHLSFVGVRPTVEIEARLIQHLQGLEDDFGDLADWHVSVQSLVRDKRSLFRARILATCAGGAAVASWERDGFWWTRLDSALDHALEQIARELRQSARCRPLAGVEQPTTIPEAHPEAQLERIETDIDRRVRRLQRSFPGIRSYDMALESVDETPTRAQRATIVLHVPGESLVSARTVIPATDDGLELAARDAFSGARRQAIRYAARRQSRFVDLCEPIG